MKLILTILINNNYFFQLLNNKHGIQNNLDLFYCFCLFPIKTIMKTTKTDQTRTNIKKNFCISVGSSFQRNNNKKP
jgi:hypothetical protein